MSGAGGPIPPGWYDDPYQPSQVRRWWDGGAWTEHTHPAPEGLGGPAAFGWRLLARVSEGSIFAVAGTVVATIANALFSGAVGVYEAVYVLLAWFGPLALEVWLVGAPMGQSYGKHLFRLAVVDARTGEGGIGPGRAFARILAQFVSAAPFGLGFLWSLWDPQRRTWHDMMTGTRVVRIASDAPVADPVTYVRRRRLPPDAPLEAPGSARYPAPPPPPTASAP